MPPKTSKSRHASRSSNSNKGSNSSRKRTAHQKAVALPTELLADIFLYACAVTDRDGWGWTPTPSPGSHKVDNWRACRTAIAATCRRWREVVLGTKLLWCLISIHVSFTHPKQSFFPSLPYLRRELERAAPVPLIITCKDYSLEYNVENDEYLDAVSSALPKCKILAAKHFFFTGTAIEHMLGGSQPISLPHLKYLTVSGEGTSDFSLAPSLEHLTINDHTPILPIPSKISSLTLHDGADIAFAIGVIKSLRNTLKYLKWTSGCQFPLTNNPHEEFDLPVLKHFALLPLESPRGVPRLNLYIDQSSHKVYAPRLTHMQVSQCNLKHSPGLEQFGKLIYLSLKHVVTISAESMGLLLDMLACTPTLEELHFDPYYDLSHPMDCLTPVLTFICGRDSKTSDTTKTLPHLRKVTAQISAFKDAETLVRERNNVQEGAEASPSFTLHLLKGEINLILLQNKFPGLVFSGREETHFQELDW